MNEEEIIEQLVAFRESLIEHVGSAYQERGGDYGRERYQSWRKKVEVFLDEHLPKESSRFNEKQALFGYVGIYQTPYESFWSNDGSKVIAYLDSLVEDIKDGVYEPPVLPAKKNSKARLQEPLEKVAKILNSFHEVVRQIRHRYNDRPTLDVSDEYDVQDLLHALLKIEFEDIRPEEAVPSIAGKCSRVDFLLKEEKIVIEVKKTRGGLSGKEVGSQLIEDIYRYKAHPDCETLVCFVYDPEGRVANPRGLEKDLSKKEEGLKVEVRIRP